MLKLKHFSLLREIHAPFQTEANNIRGGRVAWAKLMFDINILILI